MFYKYILKPVLFSIDPERAHYLAMDVFNFLHILPFGEKIIRALYLNGNGQPVYKLGLSFPNPVGLGAGFDKNAKYIRALSSLGFGFIEIGTVTPRPQNGNEKPRLFRLPEDEALINRMGFNNDGVDIVVERLKKLKREKVLIGGNIGKNKDTPNENAVDDYVICFEKLFAYVDYFVVNVSSPNTPGLRDLQDKGPLKNILHTLQQINTRQSNPKPILLKIAPDLTMSQLDDVIEIVEETGIAGLIATNTTLSRENLRTDGETISKIGNGGISGKVLAERSRAVLTYVKTKSPAMFVISVGGIFDEAEAARRLKDGADLIQIYSGFIYQGPGFLKKILGKIRS